MKMMLVASRVGCFILSIFPMSAVCFDFDLSASYAAPFTIAKSAGLKTISYARYLALGLDVGWWTPVGVFELRTLSAFEIVPYYQDMSVTSLALRRYLYRQDNFGSAEFWHQTSLRSFEPYYSAGVQRIEQQTAYLTEAETLGVLVLKAWGPTASVGADWFLGRKSFDGAQPRAASAKTKSPPDVDGAPASSSFFAEVRMSAALWPETVPPFTFYQAVFDFGYRHRF